MPAACRPISSRTSNLPAMRWDMLFILAPHWRSEKQRRALTQESGARACSSIPPCRQLRMATDKELDGRRRLRRGERLRRVRELHAGTLGVDGVGLPILQAGGNGKRER